MTNIEIRSMAVLMVILVIAGTTACRKVGEGIPQNLSNNQLHDSKQTPRLEIPDAAWEPSFFEALGERIKEINLPSLRTVPLRGSDLEVRFWYDARPDDINGFVIRRFDNQWSAIGVRQASERHSSPVMQETLGTPESGWDTAWKRLVDLGILTLPDGSSKVNCQVEVLDGGGFVVETNVMGIYRTYRYANPQLAKCDEATRILAIEEIFADQFGLNQVQK